MVRPTLLVFLALAGWAATLLTFLVHEVVGHGLTAVLLGGRFHDFYVGPLGAAANTHVPEPLDAISTAAGGAVTMAFGLVVWWWFRSRERARRPGTAAGVAGAVVLWSLANEATLDSLLYMMLQPGLGALAGVDTGDWLRLTTRWNVSPWLLTIVGLGIGVPLAGRFVRDGHRLVSHYLAPASDPTPIASYALLVLPCAALQLAYLAVFRRWWDGPLPMALGSAFGVPLLGAVGALWVRLRGDAQQDRLAPDDPFDTPAGEVRIARWSTPLLMIALAFAWVFGPTDQLRRGVGVGAPSADQYPAIAQRIELELRVEPGSHATLRIASFPLPDRGSRFRRGLTRALATDGPSETAARDLASFIANWNLDGAVVRDVGPPEQEMGGWVWEAALEPLHDSLMVRLWPLTWITESYVSSLRVAGDGVADADRRVWTRPEGMSQIDSFVVRAPPPPLPGGLVYGPAALLHPRSNARNGSRRRSIAPGIRSVAIAPYPNRSPAIGACSTANIASGWTAMPASRARATTRSMSATLATRALAATWSPPSVGRISR
jgi:hypothetical protein